MWGWQEQSTGWEAKPLQMLCGPVFLRALHRAIARADAEQAANLKFGLFDAMKRGARNRKRKRFVRKQMARVLKETN